MELQRLGDLVADPLHRVERGHGVLEDHGDLGTPQAAQRPGLGVEDLLSAVTHRSGLGRALAGEEAHDGP